MFKRYDSIPNHFGDFHFPDSLTEDIRNKRYTNAAESIIRHNIPFNYAFIFLSNCPEALSAYIFNSIPELDDNEFMDDSESENENEEEDKKEGGGGGEEGEKKEGAGGDAAAAAAAATTETPAAAEAPEAPEAAEAADGSKPEDGEGGKKKRKDDSPKKGISPRSALLMNLYVAITIPIIQTKIGKERKIETDKIVDFCKKCKVALDKNHIYKICREVSDDDLARSIYLIFGDIWEYSMILFEKKQYDKIFIELTKLPEQKRAQVIRRFPKEYQGEMVKNWLSGELPSGAALFPFVVETCFDDKVEDDLAKNLKKVLLRMYNHLQLTTPPQKQAFYHLVVNTIKTELKVVNSSGEEEKKTGYLYDIYNRKELLYNIGYDYTLRHLERRELYRYAAQICAYEKTRHKAAITYAIKTGDFQCILDLLLIDLDEAEDNRECWMRALARSKPEDDTEMQGWIKLLTTATTLSVVALDDVFYLMPKTVELTTFQNTILKTIKESQANANASNKKIEELITRSNHQRELIRVGPKLTANIEPIATCQICDSSIYTDRYLVFPCNHTVHISCFLDSMHLYFDPTMRLNLVSLSARAMRDEKRASGLADIICKSCPICGELSINVLSKGFTIKQETKPREMWALPDAYKEHNEEEEENL